MPAKSSSPEAAQNKLRKAEIKELERQRVLVAKSFEGELKAAARECGAAANAVTKAIKVVHTTEKKYARLKAKLERSKTRDLNQIDRRISILNGRVGSN